MCFKTLPVEFDERGNATLRGGIPNPYDVTIAKPDVGMSETDRRERIDRLVARNGHIKDLNMDPVTRIAGALAVHVTADLDKGAYLDSHAQATLFRGYEVILMGRDPRDAIFVSSRACGVCGGAARPLCCVRDRAGHGHRTAAAGHRGAQHDRGGGDGL